MLRCFTSAANCLTPGTNLSVPVACWACLHSFFSIGLLQRPVWLSANLIQGLQSVHNPAPRLIFRIRRSGNIITVLISPERISFKLSLITYIDSSTAPHHLTYSRVSPVLPILHPDDGCGLLPLIAWKFRPFVWVQWAIGRFRFLVFLVPPSGTTHLFTSHLCRYSRFSGNDSRPFCFAVSTKTLYDPCVTTTIH